MSWMLQPLARQPQRVSSAAGPATQCHVERRAGTRFGVETSSFSELSFHVARPERYMRWGLSKTSASLTRSGQHVPARRHWDALATLGEQATGGD
jgi:hypothetical protein